jgi:hypothetical protein
MLKKALVLLIISTGLSLAQMGESPDQSKARFGVPIKKFTDKQTGLPSLLFKKGREIYTLEYLKGKQVIMVVQNESGAPMASSQIHELMQAEAGGMHWTRLPDRRQGIVIYPTTETALAVRFDGEIWQRDDGEIARYGDAVFEHNAFIVMSQEWLKQYLAKPNAGGRG